MYSTATLNQLVNDVISKPSPVRINNDRLQQLGQIIVAQKQTPTIAKRAPFESEVLFSVLANSVNFCYWQDRCDFYPAGAGSSLVWGAANNAMIQPTVDQAIASFKAEIAQIPFPLMAERLEYIKELEDTLPALWNQFLDGFVVGKPLPDLIKLLHLYFPKAYGQDPFCKRSSLMLQILQSESNFGTQSELLPIPADYQVPKVLRALGVLEYDPILAARVDGGVMIPSGSEDEIAIRAFTVFVGQELYRQFNLDPGVTDRYFWTQRKQFEQPFHLTPTTNY